MKAFPSAYSPQGKHPFAARTFHRSARYAWRGIRVAFRREANLRRQLLLGFLVVAASIVLHISLVQLALLILTSAAVLILELMNSAIESLADAVHPHYHDKIRDAKDMAAGAVLVMSLAATAVGIVILLPPLLELLAG